MIKLILCILSAVVIQNVLGIKEELEETKCQGHDIDVTEDHLMLILTCASELKIISKAELTGEKMNCFARCLIEKTGFIDHDGTLHKEKIVDEVDKSIPGPLKEKVRAHLVECLDDYGHNVKPNDETCKSYEPLTTCIHAAYMTLCVEGISVSDI